MWHAGRGVEIPLMGPVLQVATDWGGVWRGASRRDLGERRALHVCIHLQRLDGGLSLVLF
jgi:hypothetical protein